MKEQVENELDNLKKTRGWASPIVVVPKPDNTVRICGDYKATINQAVEDESYVLPTTQDLCASLDLSHAYAQLNVDEESQEYLTVNTHKGLYSYKKPPYAVKSSPKYFRPKWTKSSRESGNVCVSRMIYWLEATIGKRISKYSQRFWTGCSNTICI